MYVCARVVCVLVSVCMCVYSVWYTLERADIATRKMCLVAKISLIPRSKPRKYTLRGISRLAFWDTLCNCHTHNILYLYIYQYITVYGVCVYI